MHMRVISPLYFILPFVILLTSCAQAVNPATIPISSPSEMPKPATKTIAITHELSTLPIPTNKLPSVTPALPEGPTPIPSPTSIPFVPPTVIPIEAYPSPSIENLETRALNGGSWTIYSAKEWQDQEKMKGDTVMISAIAVAQDGTIWFGTTGGVVSIGTGVYHFDGKT